MPINGEKRYNDEIQAFEYYDAASREWLQKDEIDELDSKMIDLDTEADIWSEEHDEIENK